MDMKFMTTFGVALAGLGACEPNTAPAPRKPAALPTLPPGPAGIYVANGDGTDLRPLVDGDWPAWSPDGLRIAFHRADSIRVIRVDGTDELVLGPGREPAWSPDGARLAFRGAEGLMIMLVDGSNAFTLVRHDFRDDIAADADMGVGAPAWSPDGERIAFEHRGDGEIAPMRVFVTTVVGPDPLPLPDVGPAMRAEASPSWSPDGSRLAIWSYGLGIATAPLEGGARDPADTGDVALGAAARPAWSPLGNAILFTAARGGAGEPPSLWVADLDDGDLRGLLAGARHASWSPDGARITLVRAD